MVELLLHLYMFNLNKNFSMDKVENIEFYSNGINNRVIWNNQKKNMCEITPEDKINNWWFDVKDTDLEEIYSKEKEWRKLDGKNANDVSLIRNIIGVLNYFSQHENKDIILIENIKQLIEKSRSIWQKCDNEIIPTIIPHPAVEFNNMPY